MTPATSLTDAPVQALRARLAATEQRLAAAEETLRAIRQGEVAGLHSTHPDGDRVSTRQGAEHPYRMMVEARTAELTRANAALRKSERKFRALFDYATDAMLLTVPEGPIIAANPAACAMFGMTEQELCSRGPAGVVNPADPRLASIIEARRRTGQVANVELTYLRKNGETFPGEMTSVILPGEEPCAFVIIRDITERKQAEAERERLLAEVQRRAAETEATLNSIADGLVIYDQQGHVIRTNAAADAILQSQPAERHLAIPERIPALRVTKPDGTPYAPEETPALRALHGEAVVGEIMVVHRPARTSWVSVSSAPIRLDDGSILGAVTTFTDITSLHELEEQMHTFLHLVSHDLRAPLTITQGYVGILRECLAMHPHQLVHTSLDAIKRAVKRMDVIIDDLVMMTRLEGDRLPWHPMPIDLATWLPEFLERSSTILDLQRIQLNLPAVPLLLVDNTRLERILTNLLTNALKYSDASPPVLVQAQPIDGAVCISITDQGQGIAPRDLPHLFEKFYRAGSSRKAEGIGLGLYVTKLMIEAYGGRIWVESEVGRGSTFSFTVPLA